jgi:L-gulonolactone oxidase
MISPTDMSTTTAPRFAHLSDDALYAALRPLEAPDVSVANWAGAFVSKPRKVFEPETYEHCALVLELARRSGIPVRAIGVVHSPSDLALTSGWMIRMLKLNRVLEVRTSFASTTASCIV